MSAQNPSSPQPFTTPYQGTASSAQPYAGAPDLAQQAYGASAPPAKTSTMAIVALILSITVSSVIGMILGYVALGRIKQTGEGGRGLALAAVILGWIATAIWIVVIIVAIVSYASLAGPSYR